MCISDLDPAAHWTHLVDDEQRKGSKANGLAAEAVHEQVIDDSPHGWVCTGAVHAAVARGVARGRAARVQQSRGQKPSG